MKRFIMFFFVLGLILGGCSQDKINDSTKQRVYSNSWDGNSIIIKQRNNNGDYKTVNEITETDKAEKLINALKNADWRESVKIDIRPPDYSFSWNSFEHDVWINQKSERIQLSIHGQSNYGTLTKEVSKTVFQILTDVKFEDYK